LSYESFDPRKTIRTGITSSGYDVDDNIYYYIEVTNNDNDTVRIPIYLHEEVRSGELPSLPYMVMRMMRTRYIPHNIAASVREHKSIIDVLLQYADTDDIDRTSFGKKILDEFQNQIRTYQSAITGIHFMNIQSIRQIDVPFGHQVIYGWNIELYAEYNDAC